MNTEERNAWLESRRSGIGSSDVAKIIGLSPWGTALDVYADKINPAKEEKLAPQLEWGIRAEPMIAGAIMDSTGWKLKKMPTVKHKEHPFLIASVDRENQDGELCEIKFTGSSTGWGEAETADIPEMYWLQTQHQLEVVGRETCWVFVLIGQCDFRRYRVTRDPEYLETVLEPLSEFWKKVESRTPPEPDWSHSSTLATVNRLFKPKPGTTIDLSNEANFFASEYTRLGEHIKELESERNAAKARLIAEMNEFELGYLPDGRSITRKTVSRAGYEVKPCEYIDFRIKKAKG